MTGTLPSGSRPAPQDQPPGNPEKTRRQNDPRYLALRNSVVTISVFNVLGYTVLGFEQPWLWSILAVLAAYLTEILFAAVHRQWSLGMVEFLLPAPGRPLTWATMCRWPVAGGRCGFRGRWRYCAGMATHWTLGCDAADPHRIAAFWATALGYVAEPGYDEPDGASIIDPDGARPAIGFLRVPEAKTAKNRMHIDIRVAGEPPWDMSLRENLIRAKVSELTGAGATAVREESNGEHLDHVVMLDPEGNEFCVA